MNAAQVRLALHVNCPTCGALGGTSLDPCFDLRRKGLYGVNRRTKVPHPQRLAKARRMQVAQAASDAIRGAQR